jgi:hypothetical protein
MTEHIDHTDSSSIAHDSHLTGDHERYLGADEEWRDTDDTSAYDHR